MAAGGGRRGYDGPAGDGAARRPPKGPRGGRAGVSEATSGASSSQGVSLSGESNSTIHSNVAARHDLNASALSVDATGSLAVLAGRRGLHVVDLEAPFAQAATLHHQTKLEVAVVKCNPHTLFKSRVASTSNRHTLIWDMDNAGSGSASVVSVGIGQGSSSTASSSYGSHKHTHNGSSSKATAQTSTQPVVATLRAHTRPVSDVSWSPMEPSLLATCSADAKTLLWDLRFPQRPVQTFNAYNTSVIQVEWNHVDATSFATAHDNEVRVWDMRTSGEKTVPPKVLITAHMQKIYGLDWHPQRVDELVTCSEDKTVKFWDVTQPRACQGTLTTGAPVWRARYTPFGDGLVTISQRMDNALRLWALSHSDGNGSDSVTGDVVHTFSGHNDLVKGMAWRMRPQSGVFQLVSWSKDQELRLWRVDAPQLEACGYDTASYAADAVSTESGATSRPGNGNRTQTDNNLRMMHAEFVELHSTNSKYSMGALKTDFVPLAQPKSAVPLGADEYTLEGNDGSLQALLALEEELMKGDDPESPANAESDNDSSGSGAEGNGDRKVDDTAGAKERSASPSGARSLPCPRISGACFSGPNMLLVFDSRVAIGQSRSSVVIPTAVAAGKVSKPPVAPNKLPRTYEELLNLRDSRFATNKNRKPPVKLLSSSNVLGSMDLAANDWVNQQQNQHQQQELIDAGVTGVFNDDMENLQGSAHGYRNTSMFYPPDSGGSGNDNIGNGSGGASEVDRSIHGGSEYLKTYFASAEYHLPVNHPEHLLSMPPSSTPGMTLSPRASSGHTNAMERSKHVEQSAPALNLDLSLSVTILDLSKLCGVSSILTYETDLAPRDVVSPASPVKPAAAKRRRGQLGAVNRSMVSWMLQAAEEMSGKTSKNHLRHVLKGLLAGSDGAMTDPTAQRRDQGASSDTEDPREALAATCAQNARVAKLAGRSDLQQIWSLLEISTAPGVELPIYKKTNSGSSSVLLGLPTTHPWSAHPFGKRLVQKVLGMYEQTGDLQALASIVCALKPSERKEFRGASDEMSRSLGGSEKLLAMGEDKKTLSFAGGMADRGAGYSGSGGFGAASSGNEGLRVRHQSSNALTQLASGSADLSDVPPAMKNTRRSSSHNEIARSQIVDRAGLDKDSSALHVSRDWPLMPTSSSGSSASSRISSPTRESILSSTTASITLSTRSREPQPKAAAPAASSGWKMDFERLENPFKTWSGTKEKDASARPSVESVFQANVQAKTGHSPATATMTLSPKVTPLSPYPLQASSAAVGEGGQDVDANDRVLLQLSFRSMDDEKCLLSSLPEDEARYDIYKEAYAEVLYRYGAMDRRNEVLKTVSRGASEPGGISIGVVCGSCNERTSEPVCASCRGFALRCSVCQLVVRGQSMFCMTCGHGGHAAHLRAWFEQESACPTGCGCWCKQATATLPQFPMEQQLPDHSVQSRSYSF